MKSGLKTGLLLLTCCGAFRTTAALAQTDVPDTLRPPSGETLLLTAHATGDQVYTCTASAWKLKEPDAKLFDASGTQIGRHFAGPSWEMNDGSVVKGKMSASAAAPDGDSIPWLLVAAVDHTGDGQMSAVTSIQRIHTSKGKAPATGCDDAHAGEALRVAYTADYVFYTRSK